jgi:hypothetical protein
MWSPLRCLSGIKRCSALFIKNESRLLAGRLKHYYSKLPVFIGLISAGVATSQAVVWLILQLHTQHYYLTMYYSLLGAKKDDEFNAYF